FEACLQLRVLVVVGPSRYHRHRQPSEQQRQTDPPCAHVRPPVERMVSLYQARTPIASVQSFGQPGARATGDFTPLSPVPGGEGRKKPRSGLAMPVHLTTRPPSQLATTAELALQCNWSDRVPSSLAGVRLSPRCFRGQGRHTPAVAPPARRP